MAEESDSGEKSEEPTAKRRSEARSEGQVAKSMDLSHVLALTAAFLALQNIAPRIWDDLLLVVRGAFTSKYTTEPLTIESLRLSFYGLLRLLLPEVLLIMLITAFFGAGTTAIQTKFLWSNKLLKPKFKQLNPINGIMRLFSAQNTVNLLKSILKLCIIGPIAYFVFVEIFPELLGLMNLPVADILPYTGEAASIIFWRIIGLLLVLAIFDYAWQYYSTHKQLKMSKTEVKEERKAMEGDEKTKMQIRSKALQRARERMMAAVPTADVVVTNPTHLAVALRYDVKESRAPKVVAKGRGYVAERIKLVAREHGVPVLERKPLARALFAAVELGQEIPYELFAAVAELLAYVYKLKNKNPLQDRGQKEVS